MDYYAMSLSILRIVLVAAAVIAALYVCFRVILAILRLSKKKWSFVKPKLSGFFRPSVLIAFVAGFAVATAMLGRWEMKVAPHGTVFRMDYLTGDVCVANISVGAHGIEFQNNFTMCAN